MHVEKGEGAARHGGEKQPTERTVESHLVTQTEVDAPWSATSHAGLHGSTSSLPRRRTKAGATMAAQRSDRFSWAAAALANLPTPLAVMTTSRDLLFINKALEQVLARGDGLRRNLGRFALSHPTDEADFARLVVDLNDSGVSDRAISMFVRRPLGRLPYFLECVRLDEAPHPLLMLQVHDPDAVLPKRLSALAKSFRLTKREASLVAAVEGSKTVAAAAKLCGLTENTGRQYLYRIYTRIGIWRLSQLHRLLA